MGQWDTEQIRTYCIDNDGSQFVSDSRGKEKEHIARKICVFIFRFRFFLVPADINNKQIKWVKKEI